MKRRAFTLIELLIVIALIILLMAIVLGIGRGVVAQSEVRETQNLMRLLDVAINEAETLRDGLPTFGIDGEPDCGGPEARYQLPQLQGPLHTWATEAEAVADARLISALFWEQVENDLTPILRNVAPHMIRRDTGLTYEGDDVDAFEFLDAWGNPIIAIHPGRVYDKCADIAYCPNPDNPDDHCADSDRTIPTPFEHRFGHAPDRRIMLVSAGPDGLFGDSEDDDDDAVADNIYSTPPVAHNHH